MSDVKPDTSDAAVERLRQAAEWPESEHAVRPGLLMVTRADLRALLAERDALRAERDALQLAVDDLWKQLGPLGPVARTDLAASPEPGA